MAERGAAAPERCSRRRTRGGGRSIARVDHGGLDFWLLDRLFGRR